MDLLPKSQTDFHSPQYWNDFFKKRGRKAFEWYGEYPELCGILHKYIKQKDNIVVVGCGNSELSENLYDVGYHNISNIDISEVVIKQMQEKNKKARPVMTFTKMDITKTSYDDGYFSVVLDKGTLDALFVDESDAIMADIEKMFSEIERILRLGGRYICISLLQKHILQKLLHHFSKLGWPIRVIRVPTENSENIDKDFHMPVFAIILTKFKKLPNMKQILEVVSTEDRTDKYENIDEVQQAVQDIQYYSMTLQTIKKRNVKGEHLCLTLHNKDSDQSRYTLYIVDSESKCLCGQFAVFIVPEGRESEWMFSTEAGRNHLSGSAGYQRLVVVTLSRFHTYDSLEDVKKELSPHMMQLSPPGFKQGTQVPFLSLGSDTGSRIIKFKGQSELSGEFVVEDVVMESKETFRRLIFLSRPTLIQSEAKLKTVKAKKKKHDLKLVVDKSYLACQHHIAMVAGLAFPLAKNKTTDISILIIGFGGGCLTLFLQNHFDKIKIDALDIDPAIVDVAKQWFEFKEDDCVKVHVADGLEYVNSCVSLDKKYDAVLLDADSKDPSRGISCPPEIFLKKEFLKNVKSILQPTGVLITNLVCRDKSLRSVALQHLHEVFPLLCSKDIEDEVNELVYAFGEGHNSQTFSDELKDALHWALHMNVDMEKKFENSNVDLCHVLQDISIHDG